MRWVMALFTMGLLAGGGSTAGCGGDDAGAESLCVPGDATKCLCKDGNNFGTHVCKADGNSFEACEGCRDDPGTGAGGTGNASSAGASGPGGTAGAGGGTGGNPVGAALFEPCAAGDECKSGLCATDGYCTQPCGNYRDCEAPKGDCVGGGVGECAPTCGFVNTEMAQQNPGINPYPEDCDAYGLFCGFTTAADNWQILICGSWPNGIPVPVDEPCDGAEWDNLQCTLGHDHTENVCIFSVCSQGCYGDSDCPVGQGCSKQGSPGTCN